MFGIGFCANVPGGEFVDLVDVVFLISSLDEAKEIVHERARPGVAGLGVGGQPENSMWRRGPP